MKVDFNKPMMTFKGEIMTDLKGQNVFVKDIVCGTLVTVAEGTKEEKFQLDGLASRIWASKEEMDITPEEATLIRKHIEGLRADMFTQIYRLLS